MVLGIYCVGCKEWHRARVPSDYDNRIFCTNCGSNWNVGRYAIRRGLDFKKRKKLKLVRRKVIRPYEKIHVGRENRSAQP